MNTPPDQSPSPQAHFEYVQGIIERITYHAEDSGYTIARMHVSGERDLVTIVGNFAAIQPGQTLRLAGFWKEHPTYGRQFQVNKSQELKPATITGIEKYLGSGLIKGIGPITAKKIVAQFGTDTLDILDADPQKLIEVPSIGPKRVARIQAAWEAQKIIKEVMLYLQTHGVTPTFAAKIYKCYGQEAIAVVSENPYRLAADIYGIGFVTADTIARHVGFTPDSEPRYRAGIVYVLTMAAEDGHCFLPQTELVQRVTKQLALPDFPVDPARIEALIVQLATSSDLIIQPGFGDLANTPICYTPPFYHTEESLAERLRTLLQRPVEVDTERVRNWIDGYTQKMRMTLSEQQRQAVEMAASKRILILTGGPGVGKTYTTRTIVALWKAMGKRLALAAPTGRAAQRLAELTGREAKTIHRLLMFDPKTMKFRFDQDHPLEADAIVIDESSMLDLFLAHSLIKAIPPSAQILLVGDVDQLPSVGPGKVLQDCIASGSIPVVRLTEVFRQAATSAIITNAHRVNHGLLPVLTPVTPQFASDCLWVDAEDPEEGAAVIKGLVTEVIPKHGFDVLSDVQVLCPGTRSPVGTRNLNTVLQQVLNPSAPTKADMQHGGRIFRVGDRVIQLVNDYNREIFNGDMGVIQRINLEEQELHIQFGERTVVVDQTDMNEMTLAWAVTVHKSQGSEYPAIILPLFMPHYTLLTRNLFYTGLTRAKKLAIVVGPVKALRMTVQRVMDRQRYTALAERVKRLPEFL